MKILFRDKFICHEWNKEKNMSTKIILGPYEILNAYLFSYGWQRGGGYNIGESSGIVIRLLDEDALEDEALFITNNSTSRPCSPYLVSCHEGVSLEGYVWYREKPADGIIPGDCYTIRKAFADEISIKIQHHKDIIEMLESNMKRIFPEVEELRVPEKSEKSEGPPFVREKEEGTAHLNHLLFFFVIIVGCMALEGLCELREGP